MESKMSTANNHIWHYALDVADMPPEGQVAVVVADQMVIVSRIGGEFFCIEDVCTHDGGPLSDGARCGREITCPRHGARFDIRDGRAVSMPATEDARAFPVKVQDGKVFVGIE